MVVSLIGCNSKGCNGNKHPKHEHTACTECGKCIAEDCDGTSDEKCMGHASKHEHVACPECGKCTDPKCDGEESDKCAGHAPKHEHTACPKCGKCIDPECDGTSSDKCLGHDKVAPVIKLADGAQEELTLNWNKEATNDFLMAGVIATDDVDGDLTNSIKISHEINNRKYGKAASEGSC